MRDDLVVELLHHFSEDPDIGEFVPHVPATNPTHHPAVWAIDAEHAPLYWFPRDCPRVAVWPRTTAERAEFEQVFSTSAPRLHHIETRWLDAVGTARLYRYDFDPEPFEPWQQATGQWIATGTVRPVAVSPVDDLLGLHRAAGIELRAVESLLPIAELVQDDRWEFSIVRLANAAGHQRREH